MARMKSLDRAEFRDAVGNLVDLGFTVPAIAHMTNHHEVSIYGLLKRMGKWKGGKPVVGDPVYIDKYAAQYMQRVFGDVSCVAPHLWGVARLKARLNGNQ